MQKGIRAECLGMNVGAPKPVPSGRTSLCPSQLRNSPYEQAGMKMLSGDIAALAAALAAPQS